MTTGAADVLIIGDGVAGATAALAAAESGRTVTLYRRGAGATALSSGALDVAPSACSRASDAGEREMSVARRVDALAERNPGHPYAVLGPNGRRALGEAVGFFAAKLGAAGLRLAPFDPRTPGHLVVGSAGRLRRAATAQASQALGELEAGSSRLGIVRLTGSLAVTSDMIASGLESSFDVQILDVSWPDDPDGPFLLPADLGRRLDADAERARFVERVLEAARGRGLSQLVLPPVLGLTRGDDVLSELEDATGAEVREALGGEASLPGVRLRRALERALESAGVKVETKAAGDEELRGFEGPIVLASGRFIGGGVRRRDSLSETVFGLPLFDGRRWVSSEPVEVLTAHGCLGHHPIFSAGVKVDARLRPVDLGGRPAREGLFAAGSVIGGYDPHAEACGMGVAVLTGYLSGRMAAGVEGS